MKKIDFFNDKLKQEQKGSRGGGAATLLRLHMKKRKGAS